MAAQLALYDTQPRPAVRTEKQPTQDSPLCAACRAREARYGFRSQHDDPMVDRPRALCFQCFRAEMVRRREAARAVQTRLPLDRTLDALTRRRRRAEIAARRALGLR